MYWNEFHICIAPGLELEMCETVSPAPTNWDITARWGAMAQWLERAADDRVVAGSNHTETARKLWQFPLPDFTKCLSDETLKAVGPFYLVSMPGEVKDPT